MSVSTFLIVLLGLAGLIITNGLFVAAEYALVSIRKSRRRRDGSAGRA